MERLAKMMSGSRGSATLHMFLNDFIIESLFMDIIGHR
jgi:hypothetical protein